MTTHTTIFLLSCTLILVACGGPAVNQSFVDPSAAEAIRKSGVKVGVLEFRGDSRYTSTLSDSLAIGMANLGYNVIDRSDLRVATEAAGNSVYGDTTELIAVLRTSHAVDFALTGSIEVSSTHLDRIELGRATIKIIDISSGKALLNQRLEISFKMGGSSIDEVADLIMSSIRNALGKAES